MLVLIKGAGDLATGVAVRLHRCGFRVIMTEIAQPTAVRREVSFCECVYERQKRIEGIQGACVPSAKDALRAVEEDTVAVIVDPDATIRHEVSFDAEIDAVMAKRNLGTQITDAPIVLALGPGFVAGADCHGVIETQRGHTLGRLLREGCAASNTGIPGNIGGYTKERLLRAPAAGVFEPEAQIGDLVKAGQTVARVGGVEMKAQIDGVLRGLLHAGLDVTEGMKAGDVDPRCDVEDCFTVSDKALSIAGGALEGLLHFGRSVPRLAAEGIWC